MMIGVFDSGVGGLSILQALRQQLPGVDFCYLADTAHAPYGERSDEDVLARAHAITQWLIHQGAKLVVVACNTATAVAIAELRLRYPPIPFVGVEPAVKLAALQGAQRVGVLATRLTLQSEKFLNLQNCFLKNLQSLQKGQANLPQAGETADALTCVPCDGLAQAIEQQDGAQIQTLCHRYTQPLQAARVDTVVLGCTHYVWAKSVLAGFLPSAVRWLDVGLPVALQTARLYHPSSLEAIGKGGRMRLVSTGATQGLQRAFAQWLGQAFGPPPLCEAVCI